MARSGPKRQVRDLTWLRERVEVDPATGCWVWQRTRNWKGYGRYHFTTDDGVKTGSAHRLALELSLGRPLRTGMHACHRCDNPPCCNAAHLFEGTALQNQRDSWEKNRRMGPRGELAGQAKLTYEVVARIRADLETGTYQRVIARRYGIDQAQISRIKNGRCWI